MSFLVQYQQGTERVALRIVVPKLLHVRGIGHYLDGSRFDELQSMPLGLTAGLLQGHKVGLLVIGKNLPLYSLQPPVHLRARLWCANIS